MTKRNPNGGDGGQTVILVCRRCGAQVFDCKGASVRSDHAGCRSCQAISCQTVALGRKITASAQMGILRVVKAGTGAGSDGVRNIPHAASERLRLRRAAVRHLQDEFLKPFACPPGADIETCCCEPESRHHTAHNQISKVIDNMNTTAVTNEATIPNRTAFVVDIGLPPWKWQWAPATENVRCTRLPMATRPMRTFVGLLCVSCKTTQGRALGPDGCWARVRSVRAARQG